MYTLGIDLHKRTSLWTLIDDSHKELWSSSVMSHPDHISRALTQIPVPLTEIQAALEPVAGWRWVVPLLQSEGLAVHIAHPRKTRLIAESSQKTDAADAVTLARLLASGYFPEARRVSDEIYELRLLLRTRNHIVRMRTSALCHHPRTSYHCQWQSSDSERQGGYYDGLTNRSARTAYFN
jgi:transposase